MKLCTGLPFSPDLNQRRLIYFILLIIILVSLFLRILYPGQNPPALNQDEAMHGVNAYSVSRTLKDHRGFFLPAQMHGFGNIGIVSSLYTYLSVPFVGLFGMSETTVRLPSLLINLALIPLVFFLTTRLFHNRVLGLCAAALLGLNPWHLHYSRIAHEAALSPFFYILICLLFYRILTTETKWRLIPVTGIVLGLSLYTYQVAWVMSPILVVFICVVFIKETLQQYKKILIACGIAFIIAFPILYMNVIAPEPWMESRLNSVSFLNKPNGLSNTIENYFYFFSPDFLFLKGDIHIWTLPGNAQHYGMFHPYLIPFFLTGIVYLIFHIIAKKEKRREILFILGLVLLYPLPAAATEPMGWALRVYTFIPVFHIIGAIGIWVLVTSLPPLPRFGKRVEKVYTYLLPSLISLYILSLVIPFLVNYYTVFPTMPESFGAFQYGVKDVVEYIETHEDSYDKIYVTRDINQPYIYILFYTGYDPALYQRIHKDQNMGEWGAVYHFDNYYFTYDDDMPADEPDSLFITRWSKPFRGKRLLKKIIDPRGDIQFQIWD